MEVDNLALGIQSPLNVCIKMHFGVEIKAVTLCYGFFVLFIYIFFAICYNNYIN